MNKEQLIEAISNLTVLELADLVKALEEKFGVSAAAPMSAAAAPAVSAAVVVEEEQTEFDVILEAIGEKKINVIKVVREVTGLGLTESKAIVDGAPKAVKEKVSKADGEEIVKKLTDAGATAKLK